LPSAGYTAAVAADREVGHAQNVTRGEESRRTNKLPLRPGDDPLRIERTNLEAGYSLDLVRFQISGVLDWLYAPKRRRLARSLATG